MKYCLNICFSYVIDFHKIYGNSSPKCLLERVSKSQFFKCEACSTMFMQQRGSGRDTVLSPCTQQNSGDGGAALCGLVEKQGAQCDSVSEASFWWYLAGHAIP